MFSFKNDMNEIQCIRGIEVNLFIGTFLDDKFIVNIFKVDNSTASNIQK